MRGRPRARAETGGQLLHLKLIWAFLRPEAKQGAEQNALAPAIGEYNVAGMQRAAILGKGVSDIASCSSVYETLPAHFS